MPDSSAVAASPRVAAASPGSPARPASVVHLITDLDVGGAEMMLARLVEHSDSTRVSSAVICLTAPGAVAERIRRARVPLYSVDMRPRRLNGLALWRLSRCLRRLKPDVLQTWLYHSDLTGLVAGTLAQVPNVVWNIRCGELQPGDHAFSLRSIIRSLAWLSHVPATVVANSAAGKRVHEQLGYRPRRWAIIPNGIDTEEFRPAVGARLQVRRELGLGDDCPLVGVLARVHPMKDHGTFLKAAAAIAGTRSDVRFVLAGRGVQEDPGLAAIVRDLGLSSRVHRLGERADAANLLSAFDVAVSSSYSEAFPNVVAEAMACGTLCVVTDTGDSAAIVGDTGVVVPPRDAAALSHGINRLLHLDANARRALSIAARDRIVTEFSIQRSVSMYEALYAELANASANRR
jgi:glycosyltransferase involved in cell wall biosynthesis